MRRAFADRAHFLGDPDYYPVPIEALSQGDYATERMESFIQTARLPLTI